ncbi:hypothetical protein CWE09_12805 [Aliidiomarina minuta]|uniref:Aminoglycoside phosphotransferase domain-containing protein n=1 Tax=Aliidiomarina minuta TaxID=880057 RepID=A0A432W3T9_9GAMM|nr:phosphotransferase [Aliidiomarina minuta]RUO24020.1 hypothetical protein CWE09_12805 [Aliidiomarina minuta]
MKTDIHELLKQLPLEGEWEAKKLNGGEVNSSWKISNQETTYFLKAQRSEQRNQIDRSAEVSLQRQLSELDLCPAIEYASDNYELVLFVWENAATLKQSVMDERSRMQILANTLWRIHHCKPRLNNWSLYDRISHYCDSLAHNAPQLAQAYLEQLQHFSGLVRDWDKEGGCFCHNDLSLDHILLSEPVKVVDWEYAGYGHPYFDIASCIEINELQQAQVQLLCHYYSQASNSEVTPGEIASWRALVGILNELWYALQKT